MGRERLEIEFGRYAEWLVEAIITLGVRDPIPAACRGTASPALFRRMADALGIDSTTLLLDVGCGVGGPGGWFERTYGCRVVGVDVMEAAARGAKRLFPVNGVVVASSRSLPFDDERFDACLALGVLETIDHKSEALAEIARVLVAGGRVGVYSLIPTHPLDDAPMADRFEVVPALRAAIQEAGLTVRRAAGGGGPPQAPEQWRRQIKDVRDEIERVHGRDPSFAAVRNELAKIGTLCADGDLEGWEFVLEKEGDGGNQ